MLLLPLPSRLTASLSALSLSLANLAASVAASSPASLLPPTAPSPTNAPQWLAPVHPQSAVPTRATGGLVAEVVLALDFQHDVVLDVLRKRQRRPGSTLAEEDPTPRPWNGLEQARCAHRTAAHHC